MIFTRCGSLGRCWPERAAASCWAPWPLGWSGPERSWRSGPKRSWAVWAETVLAVWAETVLAVWAGAVLASTPGFTVAACPWLDHSEPVAKRVRELLSAMTLDQKIKEMHVFSRTSTGRYAGYEGFVPAQPRLCIPPLIEQDDSLGVAARATGVTQLPAAVALSSAWNPSLAYRYGVINGAEHWRKGIDMALGPGVNIQRDPRWGRNFEMLSEDPYLSARLVTAETEGMQSQHVLADVKHYVAYNQETYRNTPADDVIVSDRVLHEIYLPGFRAATMQAGAASVMCSYASLDCTFDCQNRRLLTGVLDAAWGYKGFVRSDAGANHSTVASVNAGLDQEKGSDYWDKGQLAAAVRDGQVSAATVNDAVTRILTPMFRLGLFNHPPTGRLSNVVTTAKHAAFARTVAEQGAVLLKDARRALPLRGISSIAVIGPDGGTGAYTAGGGSSRVIPPYVVTPCKGIKARAGSNVKVTCSQGASSSGSLQTAPAQQFTAPETGVYRFTLTSQGPSRLTVNGRPVITASSPHGPGPGLTTKTGRIGLESGQRVPVIADYAPAAGMSSPSSASLSWHVLVSPGQARSMRAAAARAAARSQAAIVFVDKPESEGCDLTAIGLSGDQNRLIRAVAAANPDTIVVLNTGGPVTMPWLFQVRSVVEAWYPGQEDGNAIAAVLFGDVDPSGHLPETFPKSLSQVPASTPARWPGVNGRVKYLEGLDVGYRWYEAKGITPLFPFGYGLSYTSFSFRHLRISPSSISLMGRVSVAATVTNTGTRTGAEVAQLYLADPPADGEPPRQLKGFHRVTLGPGKSVRVHFTLTPADLSYWDSRAGNWVVADGTYRVMVGDSSAIAGLPLSGSLRVNGTTGARNVVIRAPAGAWAGKTFTGTTALTPGGDLILDRVRLQLGAAAGWKVRHRADNRSHLGPRPGHDRLLAGDRSSRHPRQRAPADRRRQLPSPKCGRHRNRNCRDTGGPGSPVSRGITLPRYEAAQITASNRQPSTRR
jgi:beta-glucosidase